MYNAHVIAFGLYAPGEAIDNAELKRLGNVEFDHEKIENKVGIQKRHIARLRGLDETTADFAVHAAKEALLQAGVGADQVGLIIVATDTPEFISPATALIVQGRLQNGERNAMAFDVNASCASFTTALDTAARLVASNETVEYALVIGVYNMPAYVRDGDAFGLSIFADGAGAVLLARKPKQPDLGYIEGHSLVDGTQWDYIGVYAGGTRKPMSMRLLDAGAYGLQSLRPLPGNRNVRLWPMVINDLLKKARKSVSQVDHFIFTQINRSVIVEVMGLLEQPLEKTTMIMDRYGYTGSACVPMALYHAVKERRVYKGDLVLTVASGAGLAVSANLFRM